MKVHMKKTESLNQKILFRTTMLRPRSLTIIVNMIQMTPKVHLQHQLITQMSNPGSVECNICGKILSSKTSLYTHITDSHREDIKYNCPICNDKTFNSQGGYYKHLRVKHNLSHNGVKISAIEKGRVPMILPKINLTTIRNWTLMKEMVMVVKIKENMKRRTIQWI